MFLINSRLGLFTAAIFRLGVLLHDRWHPFSRSYGVILPSSLTRVLSRALGCSPRLPVSVCGTGTFDLDRGFSWQCGLSCFAAVAARIRFSKLPNGFAYPGFLPA